MDSAKMSRYREQILEYMEKCVPYSANEIAEALDIHQYTVQTDLLDLSATRPELMGYKKMGRTRVFWRKR